MRFRGAATGVVAVAVLGLALAGCVPASPHGVATPSRDSSPTPGLSPTPQQHPGWPFQIGCDDIMSLDEARAATQANVDVDDSGSSPATPFGAAVRQGGALTCGWRTGDAQSATFLEVDVLPHATAEEQSAISADQGEAIPVDACAGGVCSKARLTAGNMALVQWSSPAHAADADGGTAAFAPILATIVRRLARPGAESSAWSAPPGPASETYCEGGTGRAEYLVPVGRALGVDPATGAVGGGIGGEPGVIGAAVARTDLAECAWQYGSDESGDYVSIWVLQGGSWAVPLARAARQGAVPVTDPKHPGAFAVDDGHSNFELVLATQGSFAEVDYEKQGATLAQVKERMVSVADALFP